MNTSAPNLKNLRTKTVQRIKIRRDSHTCAANNIAHLVQMFGQQADRKRLSQTLINIPSCAVNLASQGNIAFRLRYQRKVAHFEVEHVFEPFARGLAADTLHFVDIMRAHAQRFELEAKAPMLEPGAIHATND